MKPHLPGGRRPSWIVGACFALPLLASAAEVPDVDLRRAAGKRAAQVSAQVEAVARLQNEVPEARILWHPVTAAPLWIHSTSGFLTGPESEEGFLSPDAAPVLGDAIGRVSRFLDRNAGLFGHGSAALDQAVVRRDYVTEHSGMRTIVWQQMLAGVPIFEGTLTAHLTRQGELVSLSSRMLAHPAQAAGRALGDWASRLVAPPVAAEAATASAARSLGEATEAGAIAVVRRLDGANREHRLTGPGIAAEARARLVWVPLGPDELRLGWEVVLEAATSGKLYQVILDADTDRLLVRHCWTSEYTPVPMTVFPSDSPTPMSPGHATPNTQQPAQVNRTVLYGPPAFTLASPQGWIAAGRNDTIGNNADAHLDLRSQDLLYGNFQDVAPPRPVASGNYPLDLSESPTREDATVKNQSAAVVNAFYWVNWAHDRFYELGFTEAAGNFQNDNYGRGGLGGDAIVVDV